jgi:hypothetical protein
MVTTITPTIVNLNTSVVIAPTPSQYQQSGAVVSTGGTTLATGTYQYCGTLSAVTSLLATPLAITTLTWSGGIVTATVATMTLAVGQTFLTTIPASSPAGYNGTFTATVATTTTFTYPLAVNPGAETTPGTYTPPTQAFVNNFATTFFAQGNAVGLYVLELGSQTTATAGITALGTWDTANPAAFYAYAVTPSWDGAALNTLAATYSSPSGKKYFFPISTTATVTTYSPNKSVIATVPSPTQAATEVQSAQPFYQWLKNNPSASAPAAPMAFRYAYGVTPWATNGNQASINTVLTAYGNLILTGAEGGISTATLFKGTTMDGQQAMFWYAVDWFQIQVKQQMAAAIINGSNENPPLQYNQAGINSLLAVGQAVCNTGVSFSLALSATITATPFATYTAQNPSNYDAGIYGGFSLTVTPQLGFLSITVALSALQFVA